MTYLPRTHQGLPLPPALLHVLLAILAVVAALIAWAILDSGTTRTDESYLTAGAIHPHPADVRSIAYVVPGPAADEIRVRPVDGGPERLVATIPHFLLSDRTGARGIASPLGDQLAVLAVPPDLNAEEPVVLAALHLVTISSGVVEVLGYVDPLSQLAWSPDGSRLAAVRSSPPDSFGRRHSSIIELSTTTGATATVAEFDAFEVAPVGYSANGNRLFVVAVDSNGSALWAISSNGTSKIGDLSPGRTRDWSLSADGSRLAYVEVLSTADRAYAGRTFLIAAGEVVESGLPGNQLGSVWRPGHGVPDFGSSAGAVWHLEPAPTEPVFVVPMAWSPDGTTLVASIHAVVDGRIVPEGSLEIAWADRRVPLEEGARFLGWVLDD